MPETVQGFVCAAELQVTRAGETEPEPDTITEEDE